MLISFVVVQHKSCVDMMKFGFHSPGRDNYLILISDNQNVPYNNVSHLLSLIIILLVLPINNFRYISPLITDSGPCRNYMLPLITNGADSGLCRDYMFTIYHQ